MVYCFESKIAKKCGLSAAVVFSYIEKLSEKSESVGGNGWAKISVNSLSQELGFLSVSSIRTALSALEKAGLLETGFFNDDPYDKTKSYLPSWKGGI